MALNLQDKQAIVAEVSEVAKGALSAVVADSRGVTVDKMTELRKAGREEVVKLAYTCVLFVTPCCAASLKVLSSSA